MQSSRLIPTLALALTVVLATAIHAQVPEVPVSEGGCTGSEAASSPITQEVIR